MGLIKIDENSGWMIEEMKCFFLSSNSSLQTEIYSFKGLDKIIKYTFYSIENYHQVEGEITLTDDEWKVIAKLIQKNMVRKSTSPRMNIVDNSSKYLSATWLKDNELIELKYKTENIKEIKTYIIELVQERG